MHLKSREDIANKFDHFTPKDYPIAYVAKKWFFCGYQFFVNEDVLVPRADTEVLVDVIQSEAKNLRCPQILDLCTGSGCIAIALAKKGCRQIMASDISAKALKVARKNARLNNVKVKFAQGDLFENIKCKFDIIVCNPPYIKSNEIGKFDKSILHEPKIALDGGEDGLAIFRRIIKCAPKHFAQNGQIFLEVGDKTQAQEVKNLLLEEGFRDIAVIDDRVVYATKQVR